MDVSALQRCVGDVDIFFDKYWAHAPLLYEPTKTCARAFDDLASLDDLDQMVASLGLRASSLRMIKDGKALPHFKYTVAAGKGAREAAISGALVYQWYYEGATIVLESLHRYWQPLTDFCRELEIALGHRLQVNAYVTPPRSQGFDVHRDSHDVFVLQVSGAKHWIVYDREDEERVLMAQTIDRGASLYIPTGFPHAATTGDAASAHLTVGILTHDTIDLLHEVTKLAEEKPAFRERLDVGNARDAASLKAIVKARVEEVQGWLDEIDIDELTERVARRVASTSQPVTSGLLRQLERLNTIDEDTMVARRRGATCVLFPKDTVLKVLLADRELEVPLVAHAAMEEISRRERFSASDLHAFLDPESALVLVRRLVREALLEVLVDD
jgi:bifunctional lysine-specific demethylase and histidyl-hydroxylase NO66